MRLLYKYCSLERVEQILRTHTIRISDATKLNDPFEYSYVLGEGCPQASSDMKLLSWKLKTILPLLQQYGIYSLSKTCKSILMWAHYASEQKGICIEYDVDKDLKLFDRLEPIQYRTEYPAIIKRGDSYDVHDVLITKHAGWYYEEEIRLIKNGAVGKDLSVNPHAIRSVIFGSNAFHFYSNGSSTNDKKRLQAMKALIRVLKDPMNQHVQIKQVQCDNFEYKIHIAEVPFIILQEKGDSLLIISLKKQTTKVLKDKDNYFPPIYEQVLDKWQEIRLDLPQGIYYLSNDIDNLISLEINHSPKNECYNKHFIAWLKKTWSCVF